MIYTRFIHRFGRLCRRSWTILLLIGLVGVLTSTAVWASTGSPDKGGEPELSPTPISTLPEDESLPRVAFADWAGEYLVVWEDAVQPPDIDIYAMRVSEEGLPIGGVIGVGVSGNPDLHPDVAYNYAMDEYLVVWENEYNAFDHDIFARRVGVDGIPIGGEIHVAYTTAYDQKPVVVYNPGTFGYIVVFERLINPGELEQTDVMAVTVDAMGTPGAFEITIANGYLDEQAPAVACDGLNYMITWQGDYSVETNIYGQKVQWDGSLIGGQFGISTWEGDQLVPRISYNEYDSQYLVVWEDHHFSPWGIYGYRMDPYGNLLGSQITIASGGGNNRAVPDVAYAPDPHSYLVVWQYEYSPSDHDIYARRVAFDGSQPEFEFGVATSGADQLYPALASNGFLETLVVWQDLSNGNWDIYGSAETVYFPVLSGWVYNGDPGDWSNPMPGVVVELGCSNDLGYFGTLAASTYTNIYGEYYLPAYTLCEYYNIVETDPGGYYSIAAQSTDGIVYNSNWIYYTYPIADKVWTDNLFFDKPVGGGDQDPPSNWVNFQPPDWVNTQTVNTSEQVEDTYSGLDISTAEYQFSTNGGGTWSGWLPAAITGYDGITTPQLISAVVPFGQDSGPASQNLVQYRVADMAGNMGYSALHAVKVDSILPTNPTSISSPTHSPNIWSNNQYITVQWSGATDERSGINGYSTSFNQDPSTIPDEYRDTIDPSTVNYAYLDSSSWWFHVRTLDNAGNAAAGAIHLGPFYIDTAPPTAWMTTPAGAVNQLTTYIEWDGGDALSGIYLYDVDAYTNGTWNDWIDSTLEGAYYTGVRGQDVYFRVRATDNAGNMSDWSGTVLISFGVDVWARVDNESGTPLNGAEVYMNDAPLGNTSGNGTIYIADALLGDELSATYMVEKHAAVKGHHGWVHGPSNWSYQTYITSIGFDANGNPQMFTISNTGVTQVLQVRRDNTLVGFYLLVSVEWDADSTYLEELRTGLVSASDYLYDVTDGQMFFEVIDIRDNAEYWNDADMRIHASNQVWPNASWGGIWKGQDKHIYMGRYFDGQWSNSGSWEEPDGFRTFIHEFGHYGLDLDDEYLNRFGLKPGSGCTTDRPWTPVDVQASFMDYQYTATEMCSTLTLHPHNTNTLQDATRGGPCWNTVYDRYKDTQVPARWLIERPQDRGSIMPGPTTIPIPLWTHDRVIDNNANACAPFDTEWIYEGSNLPALHFDTWVKGFDTLYEGKTVTNTGQTAGIITILGAHNGDTIYVSKSCGVGCTVSGSSPVICSPGANGEQGVVPELPAISVIQDPFTFDISTQPAGDGSILNITLQGTTTFPNTPYVELWQDGATAPTIVVLSFDGTAYHGTVILDTTFRLGGTILADATDSGGYTVHRIVPFNIQLPSETELTRVQSDDAHFEIFLQPGSLSGNPAVSVQPTYQVDMQQGDLVVIGNPYQVSTSSGETELQIPAALNIYYSHEPGYIPFGLYRWDSATGTWILLSTNIDRDNQLISVEVNQLGIYAILGARGYRINLPLVQK